MLSSNLRWCCTGTPIGNDVVDLLGQFAVIGMSPFSIKTFFDVNVKQAFGAQGEGGVGEVGFMSWVVVS